MLLAVLTVAGCGGSSGKKELTAEGTAQKGLFQALEVQAFPLDETNGELGEAVEVVVTEQTFSAAIAHEQLTLFEATGTFTSEITGTPIVADMPLKVIVSPDKADLNANINIATTLIAELVLRDLRAGGGDAAALIQQHTDFINTVLGFPAGTDPTQLDFNNIAETSDMSDANLQLLIIGGGIIQLLDSDQLFAGGFQNIVDGILAAQDVGEAVAVLSVLNGLSAEIIYGLAQQYSGLNLPMLALGNNFFVWVCDPANNCQWVEITDPMVSVAGTTGWEAGGKGRIYVRINEVSTEDVVVNLSTASDTATMGEDFIGIARQVTVPAGDDTTYIDVNFIVDALPEADEQIAVSITSATPAYPVFQDTATVTIRDGISAILNNQDAAGMQLMSLNIASLCNPVINMSDAHCVQLDGTESLLAIVEGRTNIANTEIDLAADCADRGNCPQLGTNYWLVNFFLVAKDGAVTADEVPLGPYIYVFDTVQLVGEPPLSRMPLIRLTDDATLALAGDALTNGWDLELQARIGASNAIVAADPIPPLMPVPDSVLVGDTLLDIGVVYDVMPGADYGCTASQYAINAQYSQQESGLLLGLGAALGSGTICVDFDPGGPAAGPAVMVEGRLDIFGGMADPGANTTVLLPPGLYAEVTISAGAAGELTQTTPGLILAPPLPVATITNDLHSEGWPFLFRVDAFSLTHLGLELGYSNMRYVMDAGYSNQDPRSVGILYSNDIYYRGVAGHSGSLAVR
jgi:hypothetical protein